MIHPPRRRRARAALLAALVGAGLLLTPAQVSAQPAPPSKPAIFYDDAVWLLRDSLTSGPATSTFRYGIAGDYPLMGDWDGDGDETVGVARLTQLPTARYTFTWYLRDSNSAGGATVPAFTFPTGSGFVVGTNLVPIVGDWNGDGIDTIGIAQYDGAPNDGMEWFFRNSNTSGLSEFSFVYSRGRNQALSGDWDGDGDDTVGVYVPGTDRWLLSNGRAGGVADIQFTYGSPSYPELPVTGDWDADGDDTPGILRNVPPTDECGGYERWLLRNANSGGSAQVQFTYGDDTYRFCPPVNVVPRPSWK